MCSNTFSAGNLHAGFCGSRGRVTASGHPVGAQKCASLLRPEPPKSSSQSATPMGLLHSDQSGVFRITVPESQQRQFNRRKGPDADSVVLSAVLIRRLLPVAADL